MKSLYDIAAPAKLNLFLHVTGRRNDGYHLLQSVFVLIDWCDTLHFEVRTDGRISREDLTTALPTDDLVVRAAYALQRASGCQLGAHMGIAKHIPTQAGMGGGSSDAASTLLALNRLWKAGLTLDQLQHIGLQLGADVPFFLGGKNAWIEGIGEQITPIEIPGTRFLIVKPEQGLNTAEIFSDPDLKRDSKTATILGFAADMFGFGQNNLQSIAEKLCPGVTHAIDWLANKGLNGRMTGSGSAVFAHVSQADCDFANAPDAFQVRLCQSLEAHPLSGWAADGYTSKE